MHRGAQGGREGGGDLARAISVQIVTEPSPLLPNPNMHPHTQLRPSHLSSKNQKGQPLPSLIELQGRATPIKN